MPDQQPNILFITTDQQRYDTIGPQAPPWLRIPHFERLCHEGIRFDHAYAQAPVCVPARKSMMMGQDVITCMGGDLTNQWSIPNHRETLPGALGDLGYQTCLIGKMHFGPPRVRYGFDEAIPADDYYLEMQRAGHACQPMRHGVGQCEFHPALATVPEALTLTSWAAERGVDYLRHRRDPSRPFFLWLSFHKPHPPLDPPEPYFSMYRDAELGEPAMGDWCGEDRCPPSIRRAMRKQCTELISPEIGKAIRAAYYGLITQVDYNLGRVLAALNSTGEADNTLVMFTADHGEYLGDHGFYGKFSPHQSSAHIPWVLRLPKIWQEWQSTAGTCDQSLITHADILPTLVRAAGGDVPEWSDGQDILGVLRKEAAPREQLLFTWMENAYWYSDYNQPDYIGLTNGSWKYVWYPEGGCEQLFDLESDPTELHDLAGEPSHADKLAELRGALTADLIRRGASGVCDGKLVEIPERPVDLRLLRASMHAGFHGDDSTGDILH